MNKFINNTTLNIEDIKKQKCYIQMIYALQLYKNLTINLQQVFKMNLFVYNKCYNIMLLYFIHIFIIYLFYFIYFIGIINSIQK